MLRQFCLISIPFPLINLPDSFWEQIYEVLSNEPTLNKETLAEFVPLCQPVLLNSTPWINLQTRVRSEIFYSCIFTPSGIFFFFDLCINSLYLFHTPRQVTGPPFYQRYAEIFKGIAPLALPVNTGSALPSAGGGGWWWRCPRGKKTICLSRERELFSDM